MAPRLVALYNHWCHADCIRVFIREKVPDRERDPDLPAALAELGDLSSSMSRLVVWYSLIYVVVEGYIELELRDEELDKLLANEELVGSLRRFRNSVFHYQPELIPKKHVEFLKSEGSEHWMRALNRAFDRFFLVNLPIREQLAQFREGSS